MPVTSERIASLQRLGLSEYGARCYLALLDLGTATARDIATLGRVPSAKVYAALDQLHEKGLAGILPEHPRRYNPIPLESYLERLRVEKARELASLDRDAPELASAFRIVGESEVSDKGAVNVVRGRKNVLKTAEQILTSAKVEVLILATPGFAERARAHRDVLMDLVGRKVEVRVLVPPVRGFAALAELLPGISWRVRAHDAEDMGLKSKIVIVDRSKAFVVNFAPDDASLATGKDVGIHTDHRGIVQVIHALVETLWFRSKILTAETIEGGPEPRYFSRVLRSRAEVLSANLDIIDRGARRMTFVRQNPPDTRRGFFKDFFGIFHDRPDMVIASIHRFTRVEELDAYARDGSIPGSWDIAHLDDPGPLRFWIYDDREAFLALRKGALPDSPSVEALADQEDAILHTNNPEMIRALLAEYERMRREARPLAVRAAELQKEGLVRIAVEGAPVDRKA
ncbi:MAG TPA: helix-turn-helix domain-containing protein [Candidatus Thermoplasmatota archaeon]|nr:helix-turn-helix domain-containing protein [Candidatus Thermoplasmatota archaeon]